MAIIRVIPRKGRQPVFGGRMMVDAVRGVLRVRKWPRKRGTPRSALQRWWVDWFVQANLLAKYADPMSQARAIDMAKGSGMYPRDVLLKAMRGRLYFWADTTGWKWYSVAAQQDISESLDALAQVVGSVLVRAADRWRAPAPGLINDVLTYKGVAAPVWQAPAGGGALAQTVLPGTPIVPDGTQSQYVLDVTAYAQIELVLDLIGYASSDRADFRASVDGGLTYRSGAADYTGIWVSHSSSTTYQSSRCTGGLGNATANHVAKVCFSNLRAGRLVRASALGRLGSTGALDNGYANFDGPITHIKVYSRGGANFNAGTIYAVGF